MAVALLSGGASTDGRAAPNPPGMPPFLWGAWIGKQFTGSEAPWSWQAVRDFERRNAGRRRLSIVHWGVSPPWVRDFNYWLGPLDLAQNGGAYSLVDMGTGTTPLRDIADGSEDSAFTTWATEAKTWGHPFFLRFDFEMNGHWYAWGTRPSNRNTASDYVAAWRHVHQLFTAAGATNVLWVWCPNVDPRRDMTKLSQLYPGNAYVDWTCLDGYNRNAPWSTFTNVFSNTYHRVLRVAPSKPMMIGEVASTARGGSKPQWIKGMFNALTTRFRRVHALVWYDKYGSEPGHPNDWPVETSRASSAAFNKGLRLTLAKVCRRLEGAAKAQCLSGASP